MKLITKLILCSLLFTSCNTSEPLKVKKAKALVDKWYVDRVKRRAYEPLTIIEYGTLDSAFLTFSETNEAKRLSDFCGIDGKYRLKRMQYLAHIAWTDVSEKEIQIYLDSANYWANLSDSVKAIYDQKKLEYTDPIYSGLVMKVTCANKEKLGGEDTLRTHSSRIYFDEDVTKIKHVY